MFRVALRQQARSNLKVNDTSLPGGARVYLRNRVKGRNKTQALWDATPHKVIRRLDTGNTCVVVPLVALQGEEESRKTVHMNDILHATQLADESSALKTNSSAWWPIGPVYLNS